MPNLKFKQLLILSNSTKSANQFEFDQDLTLIVSDDNTVGKSTLVKMIFWTLGCEPDLDTTWNNLDCKSIIKFTIDNEEYEILRYKNIACVNYDSIKTYYSKITGDFSERIADIFQFKALLPNRSNNAVEVPPPAYYFLPFYIDQKKSWADAWNNFGNLQQYQNWKSTIIKYHIGLLKPKHFELELDKYLQKNEEKILSIEVQKIVTTLEVVKNYIPENVSTIDNDKFNSMSEEIRNELRILSEKQEKFLDELTKVEGDRYFLIHQKQISGKIIEDLEKDYSFAVEHIASDEIECPLCGTNHDNSIFGRSSILTDKFQAENQLNEINLDLDKLNIKSHKLNNDLSEVRNSIDLINDKYLINEQGENISLSDIIEKIAGNSIQEKVLESKGNKQNKISSIIEKIKGISKDQKGLTTEEEKELVINGFNTIFLSYIQILDAESINVSAINSPLDFAKVVKEGGAADGTRAILAYYLTIYSLIANFGNEVMAPMIIDTPNQQEQSLNNYDKILKLIIEKLPSQSQIIICSLDSESIKPIKEKAKIIFLNKNRLLNLDEFSKVESQFDKYSFQGFIE